MALTDYNANIRYARIAALRERGVVTNDLIRSDATGLATDVTAKERNALEKAEAATLAPAEAHLAALADPKATTATRDDACIADAEPMLALVVVAEAAAEAVEANRDAIANEYAALADVHGPALVDRLAEAHAHAVPLAAALAGKAAMRDLNPHARRNAPGKGRMIGGTMLPNLLAQAEKEVALLPPVDVVSPEEWGKLKRGFPAVTLSGDPVEGDRPVRVKYDRPLGTREDSVGAGAE